MQIGGALFGYDIGATSGVLSSLTSAKLSGTDWYSLSAFQSGLVVSMSLLGALAGSLGALAAGNRIGRRTELLAASVLYGEGREVQGTRAAAHRFRAPAVGGRAPPWVHGIEVPRPLEKALFGRRARIGPGLRAPMGALAGEGRAHADMPQPGWACLAPQGPASTALKRP